MPLRHPRRAVGATVVTVAAALSCASLTAAAATTSSTAPAVPAAHLRIVLASTSDWTQLRFTTGTVVAQHISATSGSGSWTAPGFGLAMTGGNGSATTVTDDLVLSDTSGAASIGFAIQKGYGGSTTAYVVNENGATAGPTQVFSDTVQSTTDWSNAQSFSVARSTLMGTTTLALPRADSRRLVLADFYPWWSTYTDPTLADTPANPRSTNSLAGVESMTAQAKANGVNGFVVSWDGQNGHGSQFQLALRAAKDKHQVITGYLETAEAASSVSSSQLPSTVLTWLAQLLKYSPNSSFLKASDGVPVVFVYQMGTLTAAQWSSLLAQLKSQYGYSVHLVGDVTDPAYTPYEWGIGRYPAVDSGASLTNRSIDDGLAAKSGAVVGAGPAKAYVATVSPGYDDQALRGVLNPIIDRLGGQRYTDTWNAALTGQPDWVLVTSWNEWWEDTQIEPGLLTGGQALAQTGQQAGAWQAAG